MTAPPSPWARRKSLTRASRSGSNSSLSMSEAPLQAPIACRRLFTAQPVFVQAVEERLVGQTEQPGGAGAVPSGHVHRLREQVPLELLEGEATGGQLEAVATAGLPGHLRG